MNFYDLMPFLDKSVRLYVNGIELEGILSLTDGTTTLNPEHNDGNIFLKLPKNHFMRDTYGPRLIVIDRIDAISENLNDNNKQNDPEKCRGFTKEEREQIREDIRKEMEEETSEHLKLFDDKMPSLILSESKVFNIQEENNPKTIISVYVQDKLIGAVQSIEINESRNSQLGQVNITVTATRIRFSRAQVSEAFEQGIISSMLQKLPFRIRFSRAQVSEAFEQGIISSMSQKLPLKFVIKENYREVMIIENMWIQHQQPELYVYTTNDFLIADEMKFEAESITHFNNTDELLTINGRSI